MNNFDRTRLTERLAENYFSISSMLEGIDLTIPIYKDSDWSIKDIVGHISTWDRQVTKSLNAYKSGKEYSIPDFDEDAFNQQQVLEGRMLTDQQVLGEWDQIRKKFIVALQDIPFDRYPGDVQHPWGDERGSVARLVQYMFDHDIECKSEIEKAIRSTRIG